MTDNLTQYDNLPSKSFESICRTCLMYSEMFSIHDFSWEEIKLKEVILNWTPLQFDDEDRLPKNMCKTCVRSMYQSYNFLVKCKNSENILNQILIKETTDAKNEEVLSSLDAEIIQAKENVEDDIDENNTCLENKESSIENDDVSDVDDPEETKTDISSNEQTPEDVQSSNIVSKIQTIKEQIKKIHVRNKLRIRRMRKAQLVTYSDIQPSSKRPYLIRKGPPYNCITCDSSFDTREELKKHKIETKHKKSFRFKCQYCQRKLDAYSKLMEHVRTHTGEKPNKCPTCGKGFNFKTDLKRHMVLHLEVKPYSCKFCNKGFTRRQYLVEHERKHTGEQLICSFCGKGFHSYSNLFYHEKAHKGPPGSVRDPMSKDRLFQCHLCPKVLLTQQTLKAHVLLHGPRNFSCEICGKTYISKNRLQDHIRFSHQGEKFSCHLCDKTYKQKSGLEFHLKSHYGQNDYPCDVCGKRFQCKGSLYQHKRIHNGDTKYQCKMCFHICINKRNLENHTRTHTGEKPFACIYCGKFFAQKANMLAHKRIHTGEKNFLCKVCGKGFYDGRGLKKHALTHEKREENSKNEDCL